MSNDYSNCMASEQFRLKRLGHGFSFNLSKILEKHAKGF